MENQTEQNEVKEIDEKKLRRKDIILIVVTVIMVLVLIAGYIYDINSFVIKRTIGLVMDDTMVIEDMDKQGFLFYRVAYQTKIKIPYEETDNYILLFTGNYGVEGSVIPYDEYKSDVEAETFNSDLIMKPNPSEDYPVWLQGFKTEDGHEVIIIIDVENETDSYIYIYYSK